MHRSPIYIPLTFALATFLTSCGEPGGDGAQDPPSETVKTSPVPYGDLDWKNEIFLLEGKPFTGTAILYHADGTTRKSEFVFRAGKYHGLVREWWENGAVNTETQFADGIRHGKNTYWDKEGKLIKEQIYDQDTVTFEKIHQ